MRGAVELFLGYLGNIARDSASLDGLQAYYINVDASTDRRAVMDDMLSKASLPGTRVSAVTGDTITRGDFDEKYVRPQGISEELTAKLKDTPQTLNKTVSCFVSHAETLERAERELSSPDQLALILEDDIEIPAGWEAAVQHTVDAAPQDWELLKLSGWGSTRPADLSPDAAQDSALKFYRVKGPSSDGSWMQPFPYYAGSAAYLVRKSSIPAVLASLRSQPINEYDQMLLGDDSCKRYEVRPEQLKLRADHSFSEIHPNGVLQSMGSWVVQKVYNFFTL